MLKSLFKSDKKIVSYDFDFNPMNGKFFDENYDKNEKITFHGINGHIYLETLFDKRIVSERAAYNLCNSVYAFCKDFNIAK